MTTTLFLFPFFFFFFFFRVTKFGMLLILTEKSGFIQQQSCFSSLLARAIDKIPVWGPYAILAGPDGFFRTWGLFLKSPETFRAYFGWHNSLCIFKTKASRGTKLCSYFCFYSLYNIWKDQLYRISRSYFYEWLFGPAKFSGLLRNRPLLAPSRTALIRGFSQ